MPIDPSKYVLPPPVGQSNELYEAYPQSADPLASGKVSMGNAQKELSSTPFSSNPLKLTVPGKLGEVAGVPLTGATGSASTGNAALDSMKSAVGDVVGSTIGLPSSATVAKFMVRALVAILGFIFVAVGLTMLGAQTRMGNEIIREVKRSIPR